jgi:hypothetical protein
MMKLKIAMVAMIAAAGLASIAAAACCGGQARKVESPCADAPKATQSDCGGKVQQTECGGAKVSAEAEAPQEAAE